MKLLNYYVTNNFLVTFLMAMGVLTFGMTGNNLMEVFKHVANGVPIGIAMTFLLYALPIALAFTIPWAALVSIMLVFGRMSADNEITAMRACGISILQIIAPIIVLTFGLTCICLYLQLQVGPHYLGQARSLIKNVVVEEPLALFTPGIPVDMNMGKDKITIYIDSKEGSNQINGVQIYYIDDDGELSKDVTAQTGFITVDHELQTLNVNLKNAIVMSKEGGSERPTRAFMNDMSFAIEYGRQFNEQEVSRKGKYLVFRQLLARMIISKKKGEDTTRLEVELNQRVALALAPIAFLLLGMPLAIRTSRRETSIGLFLSVLLAGLYYGGVLTSDAISKHAQYYPQYIVWIPPLVFQLFGAIYIAKIARK